MSAQEVADRLIREVTLKASHDLSKAMYDKLGSDPVGNGYDERWVAGYLAALDAVKLYGEGVARG